MTPLEQEIASTAETTGADRPPVESEKPKQGAPPHQVRRLRDYLDSAFPGAALPGEHPADTAIRLLRGLSAQPGPHQVAEALKPRCGEQYCNKPVGHLDEHGWVNYGG